MEEQSNNNHNQQPDSPPRSPSPSEPSLSSVSSTQIEENDRTHHQQQQEELEARSGTVAYRSNVWMFGFGMPSGATVIGDDSWSSFATAVPFWFLGPFLLLPFLFICLFVCFLPILRIAYGLDIQDNNNGFICFRLPAASLLIIFGFYGSLDLQLNSNYSLLIQPNTFFVQTIKVKQVYLQNSGMLMLYGFRKPPPLDVEKAWTETHNVAVVFEHKEWLYYLNKGSKVDILYAVKSPSSAALSLVIAKGRNGLVDWVDDPSDPNQTLSWNIIFGSGEIQQEIPESDFYYIAVGNFNSQQVEVQLNFTVNAIVYNTSNAYYSCSVSSHICSLRLYFLRGNLAVLTTTGPTEGAFNDNWNVRISYEPRWIAYCVGSGMMTVLLLLSFRLCKASSQTTTITNAFRIRAGDTGSARNPLLVHQDDDDLWSEALSSDSPSPDEEDSEGSSNKRICVICYDAPRDCFFLPCGHAASCYACATRIKEEHGLCPICRKVTKKVQRIITV